MPNSSGQVEDICFLGIHDAGNEADEIEAFLHAPRH